MGVPKSADPPEERKDGRTCRCQGWRSAARCLPPVRDLQPATVVFIAVKLEAKAQCSKTAHLKQCAAHHSKAAALLGVGGAAGGSWPRHRELALGTAHVGSAGNRAACSATPSEGGSSACQRVAWDHWATVPGSSSCLTWRDGQCCQVNRWALVQLSKASLAELRVQALACRGLCLLGRQLAQSLPTCAHHQGTINMGHRDLSENVHALQCIPLLQHCFMGNSAHIV